MYEAGRQLARHEPAAEQRKHRADQVVVPIDPVHVAAAVAVIVIVIVRIEVRDRRRHREQRRERRHRPDRLAKEGTHAHRLDELGRDAVVECSETRRAKRVAGCETIVETRPTDVVAKDLAVRTALVAGLLTVDLQRLAVGPQLGAIDLVYANLLPLGGTNLLTLDARLALNAGVRSIRAARVLALDALSAFGPLDHALLTFDATGAFGALDDRC